MRSTMGDKKNSESVQQAKPDLGLERDHALKEPSLAKRQKEMEGSDDLYPSLRDYEKYEAHQIFFKTVTLGT